MPLSDELPDVVLRPLRESDWRAVHEWARLEQVCRYQQWGPNTEEQTRAFMRLAVEAWSSRPQTRFAYGITADGTLVGNCELNLRGDQEGEISYVLHPDHWGRGLATAAARKLLEMGFVEQRLHRIYATCDPRNTGSARVLTKIGMTHEGRMRETVLIRDGWRDSDLYAILEDEWRAGRAEDRA